jgi:hypothetical protein
MRHVTDGFTSPPKEGILWICSPEKSDEPAILGTRDQCSNHKTTEAAFPRNPNFCLVLSASVCEVRHISVRLGALQ